MRMNGETEEKSMKIEEDKLEEVSTLHYLGTTICNDRKMNTEFLNRIRRQYKYTTR